MFDSQLLPVHSSTFRHSFRSHSNIVLADRFRPLGCSLCVLSDVLCAREAGVFQGPLSMFGSVPHQRHTMFPTGVPLIDDAPRCQQEVENPLLYWDAVSAPSTKLLLHSSMYSSRFPTLALEPDTWQHRQHVTARLGFRACFFAALTL